MLTAWLVLAANVSLVSLFLQCPEHVAVVDLSVAVRLMAVWDLSDLDMTWERLTLPKLYILCSHLDSGSCKNPILLTNKGEILQYVLCQVSIHYLPVKNILKQFKHPFSSKPHHAFLFYIFFHRKNIKALTIWSWIFGFPTFSSIAAATDVQMNISSENLF